MNVEIGTEAAQFPEKGYINGISVALYICFANTIFSLFMTVRLGSALKVPSHQFRSAWKWYGWIGLDMYKDRGWKTDF